MRRWRWICAVLMASCLTLTSLPTMALAAGDGGETAVQETEETTETKEQEISSGAEENEKADEPAQEAGEETEAADEQKTPSGTVEEETEASPQENEEKQEESEVQDPPVEDPADEGKEDAVDATDEAAEGGDAEGQTEEENADDLMLLALDAPAPAAEATTEEDIDAIIREGIDASNEAMSGKGNYAELSDFGEDRTVTVMMYDGMYPIKGSNDRGVYYDIIEVLVNKLYENKEKVLSIQSLKAGATAAGTITLSDFQQSDTGKIVNFILQLGLTGKNGGNLNLTDDGIGQLHGQKFSVKVTGTGDSAVEVTYTVKFELVDNVTKDDIDDIIRNGVTASNEAMSVNGKYAELSELGEDGTVTVMMYDGTYPIKEAGNTGVYSDIIGVLVAKLFEGKDKVSRIVALQENGGEVEASQGTIELANLKGDDSDAGTIVPFVLQLGLKNKSGNPINGTEKIGELDGQSFKVRVYDSDYDHEDVKTSVVYTVKFVLFEELVLTPEAEGERNDRIELDTDTATGEKTVTGTDLVSESSASGSTAEVVIGKFQEITGDGVEIVIAKTEGGEEIPATDPVGTGYVVELIKNDVVMDTVTIIVPGDVDGNAAIDEEDAVNVLSGIVVSGTLTGIYHQASLVTGQAETDAEPTVTDVTRILDIAAGASV